jgi:hypothetical protein
VTTSALTTEFRKLSGITSLTERRGWTLQASGATELVEADKNQIVTTRLKVYVDSLTAVSRELGQRCGTPLEFYSVAGDLLGVFAEMLGKGAGDKDLAKLLGAVVEKLTDLGEAHRYTNSWMSTPTESVDEQP